MNYGEPIPPSKHVEATEFFSQEDIGRLLLKAAADRKLPFGWYGGHVQLTVNDGHYHATVYLWKEEPVDTPQAV